MNAIIQVIISMLSSLLFMTSGDNSENDKVAWGYLDEVKSGLIALDSAGDDGEKLHDATHRVKSGMIGYMERVNTLKGSNAKELDYRDYERFEEAGEELAKYYLELRKIQGREGYKDEYVAGCSVLRIRGLFKEYLMTKYQWSMYDKP